MMFAPRPLAPSLESAAPTPQDKLRGLVEEHEWARILQDIRKLDSEAALEHYQNEDLMQKISKNVGAANHNTVPSNKIARNEFKEVGDFNAIADIWTSFDQAEKDMTALKVCANFEEQVGASPQVPATGQVLPKGVPEFPPGLSRGLNASLKTFGAPCPPAAPALEPSTATEPAAGCGGQGRLSKDQLRALQEDPELAHVFQDIWRNGKEAAQKHYQDANLMLKISKKLGIARRQTLPVAAPRQGGACGKQAQAQVDGPSTDFQQYPASHVQQGLHYSLTLADPALEDCPLIGCSNGFEEMSGYTRAEIIGRNCRFMSRGHPISPDLHQGMQNALLLGRDFVGVLPNYRKDGSFFWCLLHLATWNMHGKQYIIGIQSDVTHVNINMNKSDIEDTLSHIKAQLGLRNIDAWVQRQVREFSLQQRSPWSSPSSSASPSMTPSLDSLPFLPSSGPMHTTSAAAAGNEALAAGAGGASGGAAPASEEVQLKKLQQDPELAHVFEDIRRNGKDAVEKYYQDQRLMLKISKKLGGSPLYPMFAGGPVNTSDGTSQRHCQPDGPSTNLQHFPVSHVQQGTPQPEPNFAAGKRCSRGGPRRGKHWPGASPAA